MDNELSTQSILSLFETNKEQRLTFCQQVLQNLLDGTTEPLKVHVQLKGMESIIETLTDSSRKTNRNWQLADEYKSILLDSAQKHGKNFEMYNASFSIGEVGVRYDYSMCGDPIMDELLIELEQITAGVKNRQEFLKIVPASGIEILHEDELVKIFPPSKSGTTAVKTTLK